MSSTNQNETDGYPWEDIQAARRDVKLQRMHPASQSWKNYTAEKSGCPFCHAPSDQLAVFYFRSPPRTWRELCGTAGWMIVCDGCRRQVEYSEEVIS